MVDGIDTAEDYLGHSRDDYEFAKELAASHAKYIRETLEMHGEDARVIELCMYHYTTSGVHQFMHGIERERAKKGGE